MMFLKKLLIIIPSRLQGAIIPPNLPKFSGSINKDLVTYVERFLKAFITSLVINHGYYLI